MVLELHLQFKVMMVEVLQIINLHTAVAAVVVLVQLDKTVLLVLVLLEEMD